MPSPIPLDRFLPREFSAEVRAYSSSPLELSRKGGPLCVSSPVAFTRERRLPPRLAWCTIDWEAVRLLEQLGAGGFGQVYKATYHGETVAVKKVKRCAKNRLASRQSFWAELNAAQLPRHDNLVRVLAASTCAPDDVETLGMVIMEYAGNCTLHRAIYNSPSPAGLTEDLGAARCLAYSRDLARGLAFLHSHCIAHLDLKPANVLLVRCGLLHRCKIGDFGCSQRLLPDEASVRSPPSYLIGGTFTHRAPELLRGLPASLKADIYSLAITLWQMLSRQALYPGQERQCVLYAVVAYNLRPDMSGPTFNGSGAHGGLFKGIIERCWVAKPEDRPGARRLLEELDSIEDTGLQ